MTNFKNIDYTNVEQVKKEISQLNSVELSAFVTSQDNGISFLLQDDIYKSFFEKLGDNVDCIITNESSLKNLTVQDCSRIIEFIPDLFNLTFLDNKKTVFSVLLQQFLYQRPKELFDFYNTFNSSWGVKQQEFFKNTLSNNLDNFIKKHPNEGLLFLKSPLSIELKESKSRLDIISLLSQLKAPPFEDMLTIINKNKILKNWVINDRHEAIFNTFSLKTNKVSILNKAISLSGNKITPILNYDSSFFIQQKNFHSSIEPLFNKYGQSIFLSEDISLQNKLAQHIFNLQWDKSNQNAHDPLLKFMMVLCDLYNQNKITVTSDKLKMNIELIDKIYLKKDIDFTFVKNIFNNMDIDNFRQSHFYSKIKINNLQNEFKTNWEYEVLKNKFSDTEVSLKTKIKRL